MWYPSLMPSTFKIVKRPSLEIKVEHAQIKQRALLQDKIEDPVFNELNDKCKDSAFLTVSQVIEQENLLRQLTIEKLNYSQTAAICSMVEKGTRLPLYFLKRRLLKHLEFLQQDDKILYEEGKWSELDEAELDQAMLERGLKVLNLQLHDLEDQLQEWVYLAHSHPHLLLPLLIYAHSYKQRELWLRPPPKHERE